LPTQSEIHPNCLFKANIDALSEGQELLSQLSPEQYTQGYKPAFSSTIGAHFRHVLEHYRCFLSHIESGEICYDSRERDQLLEVDHEYALCTISELSAALEKFNLMDPNMNSACEVRDMQSTKAVTSTLERELLFLQSHSVHHYAMIAAMCRLLGVVPEEDFGVAIATKAHQQQCKSVNTLHLKGDATCAQ